MPDSVISGLSERAEPEGLPALLSAAVEQTADMVMVTDRSGIIRYVNDSFSRLTGYPRDEALGRTPRLIKSDFHPGRHFEEFWRRICAGQVFHGEFVNRRKDGGPLVVSVTVTPIKNPAGEVVHFVSTGRDITASRAVDEELRAKTAFLEAQLDCSGDGMLVVDNQGSKIYQNRRCIELWQIPPEISQNSDDEAQVKFVMNRTVNPEQFVSKVVHLYSHPLETSRDEIEFKDGTVLDRYSSPVIGRDGRHYGRVWMFHDITAQKRAQRELAESLSLLDATLDSTMDGILVVDRRERIAKFNHSFADMWSIPQEVLAARDDQKAVAFVLAALKEPDAFLSKVRELYARPEAESFDMLEFKDGRVLERYSKPQRLGGVITGRVWSFRDITDRKKLEARLLRTQRMESIGTLAGGIAHDLNNILAPILMSIDLLAAGAKGDPEQLHLLETIDSSAKRGAGLVRQVLAFARGIDGPRVAIELGDIFREFGAMIRETFPRDIRIEAELSADVWRVRGDPTQLHQVLLNLAVNARDAMPGGGVLTLRASNVTIDARFAAGRPDVKPGPYVILTVSDTGAGIPPAIRDRIFEPFFTTKELGKGTGLGLATVHAIMERHNGFIELSSEEGGGSRFEVYIPAETAPPPMPAAAHAAALPRGSGELVLVVDDEPAIRSVTQRALESFGYRVLTASDGEEAIALFRERAGEVAAVVTDMMMPGLDGAATIQGILAVNPAARIIATSGLNDSDRVGRATGLGVRDFLGKPFAAPALIKMVREVLDRLA
ncbi:MAG: PAS domain-containing hybrid sensor histidine kinase/response regulator [Opitutaceae bacterium]